MNGNSGKRWSDTNREEVTKALRKLFELKHNAFNAQTFQIYADELETRTNYPIPAVIAGIENLVDTSWDRIDINIIKQSIASLIVPETTEYSRKCEYCEGSRTVRLKRTDNGNLYAFGCCCKLGIGVVVGKNMIPQWHGDITKPLNVNGIDYIADDFLKICDKYAKGYKPEYRKPIPIEQFIRQEAISKRMFPDDDVERDLVPAKEVFEAEAIPEPENDIAIPF